MDYYSIIANNIVDHINTVSNMKISLHGKNVMKSSNTFIIYMRKLPPEFNMRYSIFKNEKPIIVIASIELKDGLKGNGIITEVLFKLKLDNYLVFENVVNDRFKKYLVKNKFVESGSYLSPHCYKLYETS